MIPTLFGISIACFTLIQFVPGGPVEEMIAKIRGVGSQMGQSAENQITEEEIENAHALGNQLLDAVGPSRDETVKAVQNLRDHAGEYLRRGIEDIRTAAGFIFRNDEKHMSRYPNLGSLRKRRKTDSLKGVIDIDEQPAPPVEPHPLAPVVSAQAI